MRLNKKKKNKNYDFILILDFEKSDECNYSFYNDVYIFWVCIQYDNRLT